MKIQLAVDLTDTAGAIRLAEMTKTCVDIVEVGTPLIVREGLAPVRALKARFPDLPVLADIKIMDGGSMEAADAFAAGADYVTVLAAADNATVRNVVAQARKFGRKSMADMICVKDIAARARELDTLGVDYICVHTAKDVQDTGKNPLEELNILMSVLKNAKPAVAGGISSSTVAQAVNAGAEIVVVGAALTCAEDPKAAAAKLREAAE